METVEYPIKVFEIKGKDSASIEMEIAEVFGFPENTTYLGGYDIRCRLRIQTCDGRFTVDTDDYRASTGILYGFYTELKKCYDRLTGVAVFDGSCDDEFVFTVEFDMGKVTVAGKYACGFGAKNSLEFEFDSDQSYFSEVLTCLKKIADVFGDNKGKR